MTEADRLEIVQAGYDETGTALWSTAAGLCRDSDGLAARVEAEVTSQRALLATRRRLVAERRLQLEVNRRLRASCRKLLHDTDAKCYRMHALSALLLATVERSALLGDCRARPD